MKAVVLAVLVVLVAAVVLVRSRLNLPIEVFEGEGQLLSTILLALRRRRTVRLLCRPNDFHKHGIIYVRKGEIVLGLSDEAGTTIEQVIDWRELAKVLCHHTAYDDSHPYGFHRHPFARAAYEHLMRAAPPPVRGQLYWAEFQIRSVEDIYEEFADLARRV